MIRTISLTTVLLFTTTALADHYDVYLLAGQSNMDGRGEATNLTVDSADLAATAIIFYRNPPHATETWQPLGPGLSVPPRFQKSLPSGKFGPEIGFATSMHRLQPDRSIALIKGSRGGTSLRKDWKPGEKDKPDTQGECYRNFVETIRIATHQLAAAGDTFEIRGLLWHQGESDKNLSAKDYQSRLEEFITRIREDSGVPGLPVAIGEVFDNGQRDSVRLASRHVATSGLGFGFAPSSKLSTWDDGTHFDAASQLRLGRRFAKAMLLAQGTSRLAKTKVVCFGDSITNRGYGALMTTKLNVTTINAGVGGHTSAQGLRRIQKDVLAHDPDVVVVLFGTNDLRVDNQTVHVPVEKYKANLSAIIDRCDRQGIDVVLCTIPPISAEPFFTRHEREPSGDAEGLRTLVESYRDAAKEVAAARKIPLLDLYQRLSQQPEWMSADGVHQSEAGNRIIADLVASAVSPMLPVAAASSARRNASNRSPVLDVFPQSAGIANAQQLRVPDRDPIRLSEAAQDRLPSAKMPAFSWDTLPLYAHVRKTDAFTPEEVNYLATFPLLTFEKTTGSEAFGSTDLGTVKAAEAVKRINPATKVLFYRNVMVHYGGYSFDKQLDEIPEPFLVNQQGSDKLIRGRVRAYDLSNHRVRKWWVDSMATVCSHDSIDGLFLDGNVKVLTTFLKRELPDGKKDDVVKGFHHMMRDTREALDPEKLMIANILRARFDEGGLEFMDHFDGSYLEGFEHAVGGVSKGDYIAKGISTVQKAAAQGNIIALTLNIAKSSWGDGVDEQHGALDDFASVSQERLDYSIALFLVMAERYSYLCIHDGYDVNPGGQQGSASKLWLKTFPEYKRPLGPPTGPAHRQGYQYTRDFEHASVWLDVEAGKGRLTWK